jgi:hypothetical protein
MFEDGEKAYDGLAIFSRSFGRRRLFAFWVRLPLCMDNAAISPIPAATAPTLPTTIPAIDPPDSLDGLGVGDDVAVAVAEKE